ncbi:hypothetical protein KUTeg_017216 [Tegillarca granosa]|uniref:YqaJ viral recombinase domain-containing protein n=1 Tax=Tegillarca granosa TaxID=220873 RepID=A0ABQ9EIT9_TEGGR|nr:hypothetical protein KUTeg_017216 [Tegillarca granosa]
MRRGLACEPVAARSYSEKCLNKINLYPCGIVVSLHSPLLAASSDRKVYNPDRYPPFSLFEIKCPSVSSVLDLAVTGLKWCDLYVWCKNDDHLETIYFNKDLWDDFY